MTTNGKHDPAPKTDSDLENFEELPDDQKELQRLKDLAEKSTGPEKADLHSKIREKSDNGD